MEGLVERLECAVLRLESVAAKLQSCSGAMINGEIAGILNGGESHSIDAFDHLLNSSVSDYLKVSSVIGGDVAKHAEMVHSALQVQRTLLKMAATHKEPVKAELADLLRPLSDHIQAVQSFREKNRGSSLFNHLSAVSESISALGWVAVCQKPGLYVKEMNDAAMFYTNRVLKDYKDTEPQHVEWVRCYLSIWSELQNFIREHHCTGLVWCKTGLSAPPSLFSDVASSSSSLSPPPPPPESSPSLSSSHHSALFAQLNQGEQITRGLKHVSDEQKSHKNPNLRCEDPQERPPHKQNLGSSSSVSSPPKHNPVLELEGKKWRVEHQQGSSALLIEETELRQVVYVFSCSSSTLQVKGKVNSIIIDNCKKLGLVFDNVVGIVEIINSRDIQLQVMGRVPTISINKTEGCHVYLSKESLDCEIVSAKSSEMNILVPEGDDDYREFPVPEQFKTVWDGSSLVTEPAKIAG